MFDNKNQDLAQLYRTILGLNIQCLRYHKDELTVLLETLDHKPDILALTETCMQRKIELKNILSQTTNQLNLYLS